jgi:predicted kinase
MLIILGGLPGSGKTALARALATRLGAVHLRVDSIEQALRNAGIAPVSAAGYAAAQQVAADNLRLGLGVIADSVNPVAASRAGWRNAAETAGTPFVEIAVLCSDAAEHRRRVEMRQADLAGHVMPRWADVQALRFEPWDAALTVDTAGRESGDIADGLRCGCAASQPARPWRDPPPPRSCGPAAWPRRARRRRPASSRPSAGRRPASPGRC